jgi:type IV secretion system protein TrbL
MQLLVPMEDKPNPGGLVGGLVDAVTGAVAATKPVADAVGGAVNFASDPLGAIFKATRDGAHGLANDLLPALSKATEPDLSVDWFIKAYAISFALAIVVWGFLLVFQFVAVARGALAGQEFVEVLTTKTALFFGGALFGPLIGVMLVKALGGLSESLISWGIVSSSERMLATMDSMLKTDAAAFPGGVIVGIGLMVCMIVGLFVVVIMLAVMLVTLYFSGVMAPLGMVWFTSAKHGSFGRKIPLLWFGILACHPLLFFMLGIAYNMIAASASWMKWSDGLGTLMNIIASFIALMIAGLAPMMLMKFAPVIPSGAGGQNGPSVTPPQKEYGPQNMRDVKDMNRAASTGDSGAQDSSSASQGTGPASQDQAASAEDGSLVRKLRELNSGSEADAASSPDAAPVTPKTPIGASPKAGVGAGAEAGAGGAASAAGAGGAAAGGAAAGGSEAMAAAGAAESSTGVGAAIGIPTLVAAGAMAAAEKAKDMGETAARLGAAGGEYAAGGMDDEAERYGG